MFKKISDRIALAAALLSISIALSFGIASYYFMQRAISQQVGEKLQFELAHFRLSLEDRLTDLADEASKTASNMIIINALIDSHGRETYVEPFMKSYKLSGEMPFLLTLCDFEGKPIVSNSSLPQAYVDKAILDKVIADGDSYADIQARGGSKVLRILNPVIYRATGMPEGILALEVKFDDIVKYAFKDIEEADGRSTLAVQMPGGQELWSTGEAGKIKYRASTHLKLAPPLDPLGLTISHGEVGDTHDSPLRMLKLAYVLAAVAMLAISLYFSRIIARRITAPLEALSNKADEVAIHGNPSARMDVVGEDEVAALAASFNEMLKRLDESHERLEQRVEERTQQLAEANIELKHEIALRTEAEVRISASLKEKEILLTEIHHRVKNNLNIITALLNLQAGSARDEALRLFLRDTQGRVMSIALVHDHLYRSLDKGHVDAKAYLTKLVDGVAATLKPEHVDLEVQVDDGLMLDLNTAVRCGLIANELITNAFKYAFPDGRKGRVTMGLCLDNEGHLLMEVTDNGVGLPHGMDTSRMAWVGFDIVRGLAAQSKGKLDIHSNGGTACRVQIPYGNGNV